MKKYFIPVLIICLLTISMIFRVDANIVSACDVNESYDRADSVGLHFIVYDDDGSYLGYVTQLNDLDNKWDVWIEGVGALNTVFESKEEAVEAVCNQDSVP